MAEMLARRKKTPMAKFENQMKDMAMKAMKQGIKGMPPLDLPKLMNDPRVKGAMEFAKDEKF